MVFRFFHTIHRPITGFLALAPRATLLDIPLMDSPQAIFFDFDGVLLDTEPVHCACWAEMLATVRLTLTWEYYRDQCIGIEDRDMLRIMAKSPDPPRDWNDLWELYPAKKRLFQDRMTTPPFEVALIAML